MVGFTPVFGGTMIYPSQTSYLTLVTAIDVELSWPIEQAIDGNIVADIIDVSATASGVDITIPDARQVTTGYTSLFNNVGANTFTVKDATGGTIMTVASGEAWQFYLTDNTTEAGTWKIFQYGAGTSTANAAALAGAGLKAITTTLNQKMAVSSKSSNYVIVDGDRAKAVVWTSGAGAFTLPDPATVGADWFVAIRNSGSGALIVTPAAGTIDGSASKTFSPSNSALVVSTGTAYFTVGFGQTINSVFDFITIPIPGTGDYTLSGGELNRIAYEFTGILTGARNVIVPALIQQYWVDNETTGAFDLTIKTALGTGVIVPQGSRTILYCDGTNVVSAETVAVTVPVTIAQGGTSAVTAAGARTNLAVPPNTRLITAGAGLTGGGDLSADRTVDVGAGTGITVNANDVALSAGTLTSLGLANTAVQPARTLTAGAGLVGGGDLSADRSFNVGAGTGITVNADDVALDTSSARNTDHTTITVTGATSLTGGGNINANQTISLVNDSNAPGNNKYYGTGPVGTKGFFDVTAPGFKFFGVNADGTGAVQNSQGIDSVTRTGVGAYTIDFTSLALAANPFVAFNARQAAGTVAYDIETISTTQVSITTYAIDGGAPADEAFSMIGFGS